MATKSVSIFDPKIIWPAIGDAFKKLDPRLMIRNPVMFVTMVGAAITTVDIFRSPRGQLAFVLQIAIWLWFTVLFANFAEAMAEGRGKAQADTLRKAKGETIAQRYTAFGALEQVASGMLRAGDSDRFGQAVQG